MSPDIVQVTAYYPPHLGGQEVIVQGLARQLAIAGQNVEVVSSDRGAQPGTSVEDGVRITRLRSGELGHTAIVWSLFFWILRRARRESIVHVHMGQAFTPEVVWLASKIKRFRYVIHLHIDPVRSGQLGRLLPLYKRLVLGREVRHAAGVIVLNDEHRRMVEEDYHYRGKVFLMSNGVDDEFFELPRKPVESLNLLFVGRLSPQKNLTALFEALGKIDTEFTADVIGDGECRNELEELIDRNSLGNVTLRGRLSRAQIMDFYSTASALVLPSLYEAQPVVLLEAMACRVPVICTNVVGVESIARDVAILVDPTATGIHRGIKTFIEMSAADRQGMADAAFARVEGYRWKGLTDACVQMYEEVPVG